MKLGLFTVLFGQMSLDEVIKLLKDVGGLSAVELGTGNYPGSPHVDRKELLSSKPKREALKKKLADKGFAISALSCHGNPLHPNPAIAKEHQAVAKETIRLAGKMGIKVVVDFSGCPGDSDKAKHPNWVTCPWPEDFTQVLEWQWEKKVIPYWKRMSAFAANHGVKIALEMHPGFVVYNTESMIKLRKNCGKNIGANFDPSHLFWQGMDPLVSLKALGKAKAIFHVHGKDCRIDPENTALNGVLDTKHYGDELARSWVFRTIGYGHGYEFWNDFISLLRVIGYDGTVSIEHEDSLMSVDEGFQKAVAFLKNVLTFQGAGEMWWA